MSATTRAQIITRRTYNRPINEEGTKFETWAQTIDRCIGHQKWLWERAHGRALNFLQAEELEELRDLLIDRKVGLSGRTFWLGGTEIAKTREVSQFNCAFLELGSVHDYVDLMWLLLNGVGGGFWPKPGTLNGFQKPVGSIEVLRSQRTLEQWAAGERGRDTNLETWDPKTRTWTISVGDSAEAWAKAVGKLLAGKYPAAKLVIDLREIRPAGMRLRGYGWISSGDRTLSVAMEAMAKILSRKAGRLLSFADLHDIANWCGTVLSTRRSAQIALCDYDSPNWREFAGFKKDYWINNVQREQSNNSLVFWHRPTKTQLTEIFDLMLAAGGSEPGFLNGAEARARAPWFAGMNPCAEILLADKGFCNLVNINLGAFLDDPAGLMRATYIISRANYRQTCVDLRDGVLQEKWHQNNQFLRLCGVSLTGQAMRPDLTAYDYRTIRNEAVAGAYSMAVELDMPRPKNVTTGKPEGTISKCMDATEGAHKPLARYILNNVAFSGHDALVEILRAANYRVIEHPTRPGDVVISLPVAWDSVEFTRVGDLEVNLDTAIQQLDHYKMLMDSYVEQNQSVTISYDPSEVPAIVDWLFENWDHYVGVSFLLRADPTKTAADLGYPYLPQQPVSKAEYDAYVAQIKPVNLDDDTGDEMLQIDDCSTGACPIR
ncbi:MAG: ribonucleoside-triphosphate reductase, adenosylcobalamin-dependent [Leptothrix sp. (in: b-proteobacteria)]